MAETDAWRAYVSAMAQEPPMLPGASALRMLRTSGRSRAVLFWGLRHYEQRLKMTLPQHFQAACENKNNSFDILDHVDDAHRLMTHGMETLQQLQKMFPHPNNVENLPQLLLLRIRFFIAESIPSEFPDAIYRFFVSYLKKRESLFSEPDTKQIRADVLAQSKWCDRESSVFCSRLATFGLSRVVHDALCWAVFERLDSLVLSRTSTLSSQVIPDLLEWVHEFVTPCVSALITDKSLSTETAQWPKRLTFHLHEAVCNIRTNELLHIIDVFPASMPALRDLRDCILNTDRKSSVANSFRDRFVSGFLNAGTLTDDILLQYVKTIRVLRFLDPSGVLLDAVSNPVRDYLRRRPDTVRCIVSGMIGDSDLYEELQREQSSAHSSEVNQDGDGDVSMDPHTSGSVIEQSGIHLPLEDIEDADCQSIDGDYYANFIASPNNYVSWAPDPIDAPVGGSIWRKCSDAITTLITIYGNREQIVAEYRGLLADKLVSNFELDLDKEERILHTLTERFGKEAMHECTIMLKDMKNCRETWSIARNEVENYCREVNVTDSLFLRDTFDTLVISKEFWPKLLDEGSFRTSEEIESQMIAFSKAYERLKVPRKLIWQPGLGAVEVNVAFRDGRKITMTVTPMQATILSKFAENGRMSVKQLSEALDVQDVSVIRRKVQSLVNLGIIRVSVDADDADVYEVIEDGESGAGGTHEGAELDIGADDDNADDEADGESEKHTIAVYESYVLAMLQNLKQLSLDQIHSMLQKFVQTPVYDRTQAELATFLTTLIEKGKIELAACTYRLKK